MSSIYSYVGLVNPNLICCICHAPYVEPVTARTCTHTFCNECILRALSHSAHCPIDRSALNASDLTPAGHTIRSLVNELRVECSNTAEGCDHTCERQLLHNHLKDSCSFTLVPCPSPQCPEQLFRKDATALGISECIHVNVECDGCSASVHRSSLSTHFLECPRQQIDCPDCHANLSRSELSEHSEICPDSIVKCHHSPSGCGWMGARSSSSGHLNSCPYEPIRTFLIKHDDQVSALKLENVSLKQRVASLEGIVESFRSEMCVVKELLGPWTRLDADEPRISRPLARSFLDTEPINTQLQAGSSTFSGERGTFSSGFPDRPSAVGALSPNQDILASYFPPESDTPSGQRVPDPRHRSTHRLSTQHPHLPRSNPHRVSVGLTSSVESSGFMHPTENRHPSATRFPQAPQIPAVDMQGTLEDSFNSLHDSVVALSSTVISLSNTTELALGSETLRLSEEVVSLRSSVHGLRMQVHGIMVDRHAQAASGSEPGAADYGWLGSAGFHPPRFFSGASGGGVPSLHGTHANMPPTTKL